MLFFKDTWNILLENNFDIIEKIVDLVRLGCKLKYHQNDVPLKWRMDGNKNNIKLDVFGELKEYIFIVMNAKENNNDVESSNP